MPLLLRKKLYFNNNIYKSTKTEICTYMLNAKIISLALVHGNIK